MICLKMANRKSNERTNKKLPNNWVNTKDFILFEKYSGFICLWFQHIFWSPAIFKQKNAVIKWEVRCIASHILRWLSFQLNVLKMLFFYEINKLRYIWICNYFNLPSFKNVAIFPLGKSTTLYFIHMVYINSQYFFKNLETLSQSFTLAIERKSI